MDIESPLTFLRTLVSFKVFFSPKSLLASGCFLCCGFGFHIRAFPGLSGDVCLPAYMSEGLGACGWLLGLANCDIRCRGIWLGRFLTAPCQLLQVSLGSPEKYLPASCLGAKWGDKATILAITMEEVTSPVFRMVSHHSTVTGVPSPKILFPFPEGKKTTPFD